MKKNIEHIIGGCFILLLLAVTAYFVITLLLAGHIIGAVVYGIGAFGVGGVLMLIISFVGKLFGFNFFEFEDTQEVKSTGREFTMHDIAHHHYNKALAYFNEANPMLNSKERNRQLVNAAISEMKTAIAQGGYSWLMRAKAEEKVRQYTGFYNKHLR